MVRTGLAERAGVWGASVGTAYSWLSEGRPVIFTLAIHSSRTLFSS